MESVWRRTARLPSFPPLEGNAETEVLIVGGGMAGVLCAYFLKQAGVDCLLLEAETLGGGVTGNTTAKITSQHGLIYHKLTRSRGAEAARLYLELNQAALERFRALCRDMDCDFQEQDAFVYSRSRDKLEREAAALNALGFPARLAGELPLPVPAAGAVCFPGQAQFHPLRFLAAIARGLPVHEHTKVLELAPGAAFTRRGTVRADRIILATHFPMLNKHGGYWLKLYQHRSYVLALRGAPAAGGMYVDEDERGLSFRDWGDLLLLGGGGHRTGKQGGGWAELAAFAKKHYPQAREAGRWAAQDCMSLDGIPYAGLYSSGTEGLYTAAGFNKWGMTSSMAAALVLADLVQGKENPYAGLLSPSRGMLRPQLAVNALEAAVSLLTPASPRCPHMGCALKYNPQEHSWDCPCHGSRFQEDGRLIDNPATDDLRSPPAGR
ncbi:MAG: FAD-dependent oxidoreductase [Lawsonibacter sp.]|nr:FAD-dependent oxidoreductase [Lawsonibacter sp.]